MTNHDADARGWTLPSRTPAALATLAMLVCLGLAGCGGSSPTTPTPAPAPAPTPTPGPTPTPAGPTFQTIDIDPIANAPIDHISAPTGRRTFAGVPFDIRSGQRACLHTQHQGHPEFPTEATLPLSAGSASTVHLLLTGAYVVNVASGRTIGDITLTFANGEVLTVPIVAWSSIREDWLYTDEAPRTMAPPAAPVTWDNVFEQSQARGGRPALGFIDRVRIQVPENLARVALSSLRVRDTSQTTAQSINSSIRVMAVTLESL
jgi:hypothetical protein